MDARTGNSEFEGSQPQGGMSSEELDALMRANGHRKARAYVRDDRPRSKAAESQEEYRKRQQAKGRDQFQVTTTTDPLKRAAMKRCIQTIEYDEAGATALQAILDDPTIADLARVIASRRHPDGAAQTNDNPEASGPGHVVLCSAA